MNRRELAKNGLRHLLASLGLISVAGELQHISRDSRGKRVTSLAVWDKLESGRWYNIHVVGGQGCYLDGKKI